MVDTRVWDPFTALGLQDVCNDTWPCHGEAVTRGRRCRMPVNEANRNTVERTLHNIAHLDPRSAEVQQKLKKVAGLILCVRFHQDQASDKFNDFNRRIFYLYSKNKSTKLQVFRDDEAQFRQLQSASASNALATRPTKALNFKTPLLEDVNHKQLIINHEQMGRRNSESEEESASLADMRRQVKQLSQDLAAARQDVSSKAERIDDLRSKNNALKQAQADLRADLEAEQEAHSDTKAELEDVREEKVQLAKTTTTLKVKAAALSRQLDELEQLREENRHLKQTTATLKTEAESHSRQLEQLDHLQQKCVSLEQHTSSLLGQLTSYSHTQAELEAAHVSNKSLEQRTLQLESQIRDLSSSLIIPWLPSVKNLPTLAPQQPLFIFSAISTRLTGTFADVLKASPRRLRSSPRIAIDPPASAADSRTTSHTAAMPPQNTPAATATETEAETGFYWPGIVVFSIVGLSLSIRRK